jgi:hypothetical protein
MAMRLNEIERLVAQSTMRFIERNPELFWSLLLTALVAFVITILAVSDNVENGYALHLLETDRTLLSVVFSISVYLGCLMAHDTSVY